MPKLSYRTIESKFEYEIPKIKGSRFLTYLFPCEDKETAEILLEQVKKEYFQLLITALPGDCESKFMKIYLEIF